MSSVLSEQSGTVVALLALIVYFIAMDVRLYHEIQLLNPSATFVNSTIAANNASKQQSHSVFSPFNGMSVKKALLDQPNHYIFTPMAEVFNRITHFTKTFYFISPNTISFIGFACTVMAANLMTYDSLSKQRLAVLVFQFRTFFDALDGVVARERFGVKKFIEVNSKTGFMVDSTADTFGFVVFMFGCYVHLRRHLPKLRFNQYQRLPLKSTDECGTSLKTGSEYGQTFLRRATNQVLFVVLCFIAQLALSASFWRRYVDSFHEILESSPKNSEQMKFQIATLRSTKMSFIILFWRISNANSLMQMLLVSILLNRLWEFLKFIQYKGLIVLIVLILFTENYLKELH